MKYYEHHAQVTVPTPLLTLLAELGFKESSYVNDVWPSWSYAFPCGEVTASCHFIGTCPDGEIEPNGPSICNTIMLSCDGNHVKEIPLLSYNVIDRNVEKVIRQWREDTWLSIALTMLNG